MKIREKGAEREEWKRREAHAYDRRERGRGGVWRWVRVVCLCLVGMMFVMRVCAVAMEACNDEITSSDELCTVPALVARATTVNRVNKNK